MDKTLLVELQETTKALKAAVIRSQNGVAGLINISKLGPSAAAASTPILTELRSLESEIQRLSKAFRDLLSKAAIAKSASD